MNKVILVGRLGQDPEDKGERCTFGLATSEKKGEVTWHNIVAFGKTAELCCKYLAKGSQAAIEGRLNYFKGDKGTFTSIVADRVEFIGAPREAQPQAQQAASDQDIPF